MITIAGYAGTPGWGRSSTSMYRLRMTSMSSKTPSRHTSIPPQSLQHLFSLMLSKNKSKKNQKKKRKRQLKPTFTISFSQVRL
ncbi:MAG: hypothetical protein KZQ70_15545 [gamma proteobacterium symbiont of Lucinoma myriamae]|nr:hypothetical protein [gamma proteobacterium symbiont of Lucinoma myriamae]